MATSLHDCDERLPPEPVPGGARTDGVSVLVACSLEEGVIRMVESSNPDDCAAVPIDAIPLPIAGYHIVDGVPTIRARNDAFTEAFESVDHGESVRNFVKRSISAEPGLVDEFCAALAPADQHDVEVELDDSSTDTPDGQYRLHQVDAPSASTLDGFVLASPLDESRSAGIGSDRIASVISHDLRNPLDVANAHLRAAKKTGDAEHFDEVERSHDRMERIIRDVLTLARGEQAIDSSGTVEVDKVAADAWSTVDTDDATLSIREDLPTLRADRDRLQRLFENLYRNSVEHAPQDDADSTDLQVTVGSVDSGFFVADDGRGIPDAERTDVFEPGYSAGKQSNGTGLGLTIVERIAAAHDWHLSLTASSAGGARFEFHTDASETSHAN